MAKKKNAKKPADAEAISRQLERDGVAGAWFEVTLRVEFAKGTDPEWIEEHLLGILDKAKLDKDGLWTDLHCDHVGDGA